MIEAKNLTYSYRFEGSQEKALDDFTLTVRPGELVAILGHNGCGKSTFARHCNALIPLQGGDLTVAGLDVRQKSQLWAIRRSCGMVFQNPDNQFVSSLVEEDIAFGLRNFGFPEAEIPGRIAKALDAVGMAGFEQRSPHLLSGGQKQRIAIAGVLAVDPDIMVFDEVTAMLDPEGREEVLSVIRALHEAGRTIVIISHYIEEAVFADRVVLVHDGRILAQGTPREMLTDLDLLARTGLTPPLPVQIWSDLRAAGHPLDRCPLTLEELVDILCPLS